jgi:hypothetical protein
VQGRLLVAEIGGGFHPVTTRAKSFNFHGPGSMGWFKISSITTWDSPRTVVSALYEGKARKERRWWGEAWTELGAMHAIPEWGRP